ncbi:hypothetical protein HQQ94_02180 [Shewanella sp. VB17]|uniref:hypothetical protein n=1 Tax=Shewanella sp. VB17 TaxID=2739432 RepID=UPI001564B4FB|nr:hypothetical protein [Shewanella sp. VB17]NRD72069.1 hypothetical protein [Shewanella sp. VB17]
MALSRKEWNNIIILASVLMIAILTLVSEKTSKTPSDVPPLFDQQSPLAQLQMNELWLNKGSQWQCHEKILNCQIWAKAWSEIRVSPVPEQQTLPKHNDINQPIKLTILIANNDQPQTWIWYQKQGLLLSPSSNLYLIPPSLRESLTPITVITTQSSSETDQYTNGQ